MKNQKNNTVNNNVFQLTKIQMLQFLSINETIHEKDKKKQRKNIMMLIVMIFLLGYFGYYSYLSNKMLMEMGYGELIPANILTTSGGVGFIFSLFRSVGLLFRSKDYDLLASMPIKRTDIVLSKIMTIYFTCIIFLLFINTSGIILYAMAESTNPFGIIAMVMSIFVVPLIPIIIGSTIGSIVSLFSIETKRMTIIRTLIYIILTVGILVVSFQVNLLEERIKSLLLFTSTKGIYINPLNGIYLNAIEQGNLISFVVVIAATIAVVFGFCFLMGKYLKKIVSSMHSHVTKKNFQLQTLKKSNLRMALYKKELKRYFSSTIYLLNTSIGYILMVLFSAAILFLEPDAIDSIIGVSGGITFVREYIPIVLIGFIVISSTTSVSISMEGKNWWLMQSLPIDAKTLFESKLMVAFTISIIPTLISSILVSIGLQLSAIEVIVVLVLPQIMNVMTAEMGIFVNRNFPKMDWNSETEAVKQSMSVLVHMFLGFAILGIAIGSLVWLKHWNAILIYCIMAALFLMMSIVFMISNNRASLKKIGN